MEQLSRLLLQVYIDKVELKTTIENIIQNRFVDEQLVNINGFDLELKEFEDFALEVSDSEIAYGFITKLKIKSSSISGVEGKAKVKLNFSTQFSISEDWQLKTKTYLKEHQWIEKPIMKLKIVSIPTTGLLELLIGAFDDKMCSEIDGLIEKGSDLQKILKPILSNLKNPLQIERISDFNFNIKPQSLNLFLEDHSDKDIKIKIVSEAGLQGKIKAMEATEIISDLPKIRIQDFEPVQSKLHLYSEISHEALSKLIVKELQEIDFKGKKVRIEAIDIKTEDTRLNLEIDLDGSLTGKVFLNFEPILDKNKKIIELTDLKFKLESNQFFAKTASWLFKSEIERQVSKYAKVEIDDILTNLRFSANKKLENMELYPGLYLTADIDNVQLNTMELLQDGLSLQFEVDSDFSAKVRMQKSLTQT